jgi:hypothetical protein
MHYVIQEDIFRESNYGVLLETIKKFNLSHDIVRIFPYVDKICNVDDIPEDFSNVEVLPDYMPPTNNVFCFGAIKLARIANKYNWYPGSMMNENHDYRIYSQYYKNNLLNYDSEILSISSEINWKENELKFIRPAQDTKSFTGKIYDEQDWNNLVEIALNNETFILNKDTVIQISSPKNIQKEIRFWVVGGRIITGSQYRFGNKTIYNSYIDEDAEIFAQKMVDIYQPAEAFVIDICLTNNEWEIVEINCINAAGLYLCDMQKLITELDYYFENKL